MGNIVSFASPRLQGAISYDGSVEFAVETSYAFDPRSANAFGVPATVSVDGADATEAITPTITVPAATAGGDPATYTCNAFAPGVTEASLLCPGASNTDVGPGIFSINFLGGDIAVPGYYTAAYAFSVVTLSVITEGDGGPGEPSTVTSTTTTTKTLPDTTTTVPGDCSSGTSPSTGSGVSSRPPASTGSVKPSSNSTQPHSTGASSLRPSGSIGPSGSLTYSRSNTAVPTGKPSNTNPSGSNPSGGQPSVSGRMSSISRGPSGSHILTITNPSISTTSTSTQVITTTMTTVITTYVPCSTAIRTEGGSTIYASSMTPSVITQTVTSTKTQYTVICPATKGEASPTKRPGSGHAAPEQAGFEDQSPVTTVVLTTTTYVCPTPPPPPPCPTAAAKAKRDAGFDGPNYTLSGGDTGPVITINGDGEGETTTTTVTSTETVSGSTATVTGGCSSTGNGPYPSSSSEDGGGKRVRRVRV